MPWFVVADHRPYVHGFPAGPASPSAGKMGRSLAGSRAGPYPVGNPSAQPDQRLRSPSSHPTSPKDQTCRLVRRLDLGRQARIRLSQSRSGRSH